MTANPFVDEGPSRYLARHELINTAWRQACRGKDSPAIVLFAFDSNGDVSGARIAWSSESAVTKQKGEKLLTEISTINGPLRFDHELVKPYWIGVPAHTEDKLNRSLRDEYSDVLHNTDGRGVQPFSSILQSSQALLGADFPGLCKIYTFLGDYYFQKGFYQEHDALKERELEILLHAYQQAPDCYAAEISDTLNQIQRCYLYRGDLKSAQSAQARLVDLRDKGSPAVRGEFAVEHLSFAEYFEGQNDMAKAAQSYRDEIARHSNLAELKSLGRPALLKAARFFIANEQHREEFLHDALKAYTLYCSPYLRSRALPPDDLCQELMHVFAQHNESGLFNDLRDEMLNIGESSLNASPHPGSYGFVDKDGQWVISPIFDMASGFDGEFATVSFEADKRVNVSLRRIDRQGRIAGLRPVDRKRLPAGFEFYRDAAQFSEGLAAVKAPQQILPRSIAPFSHAQTLIGFVDEEYKFVIPPRFSDVSSFQNGVAVVGVGGFYGGACCMIGLHNAKYGLIDKNGAYVIEPQFTELHHIGDNLYRFTTDTAAGIVDATGKVHFKIDGARSLPESGDEMYLAEFRSVTPSGLKYGYVDARSNLAARVTKTFKYTEGLCRIEKDTDEGPRTGYIDKSGELVIPCSFVNAGEFRDGLAKVEIVVESCGTGAGPAIKTAYINKSGSYVVSPIYDKLSNFDCGVAKTTLACKRGLVDTQGRELCPPIYDELGDFYEGYAVVSIGGKYGLINLNGELVLTPKFDQMERMQEGRVAVAVGKDNKALWGFVDERGTVKVEHKYQAVKPYYGGMAPVAIGTADGVKWGFVDDSGVEVVAPQYHWCSNFLNGRARVCNLEDGIEYFGILDGSGKVIVPVEYRYVGSYSDGLACVGRQKPKKPTG